MVDDGHIVFSVSFGRHSGIDYSFQSPQDLLMLQYGIKHVYLGSDGAKKSMVYQGVTSPLIV